MEEEIVSGNEEKLEEIVNDKDEVVEQSEENNERSGFTITVEPRPSEMEQVLYGVPANPVVSSIEWTSFILFVLAGIWGLFILLTKRLSKVKTYQKVLFFAIIVLFIFTQFILPLIV